MNFLGLEMANGWGCQEACSLPKNPGRTKLFAGMSWDLCQDVPDHRGCSKVSVKQARALVVPWHPKNLVILCTCDHRLLLPLLLLLCFSLFSLTSVCSGCWGVLVVYDVIETTTAGMQL